MSLAMRASLVLLLVACGGGSPTGPSGPPSLPGGGSATATVDGQALGGFTLANATHAFSGGYTISLTQTQGTVGRSITLSLMNIPGPGTYPLGTGAGVSGGTGIYVDAGAGWTTPLSGEAGTITLTTLTDTRIVGSFAFTADQVTGGATGSRAITGGSFDLPMTTTGTFAPVPEGNRNVIRATLGGASYNASTIIAAQASNNALVIAGNNTRYSIAMTIVPLTATGSYPLGQPGLASSIVISAPPGASTTGPLCCWSSAVGGATGSVVVTSLTATRVQGTFTFTLPASGGGATSALVATGGSFDIGLP